MKLDCSACKRVGGIPIPVALDLLQFIFKLESEPKSSKSLRRLGSEVVGFVKEKNRSSTYAKILYWLSPIVKPCKP